MNIWIYLLIGIAWAYWLERFTTGELEEPYNSKWTIAERVFHIALWPINLSIFLYSLYKHNDE